MHPYQRPMQPWPGLARWARQVDLPRAGLRLFLYDTAGGEAAPILLLHGLGDEADTWRHLLPRLTGRVRVLAPDLPGFGRSAQPGRSYTPPFLVETVLELLEVLEIERLTLAGHSMGAVIAQAAALECPQRVERLVLIGGSLVARQQKLNLGTLLFLVPGLGERLYNRLRKDPQAAYRSLAFYYADLDRLPEEDRAFLFQRVNERVWSDGQRRAFFTALRGLAGWLPSRQRQFSAQLKELAIPTLLIWGAKDRINPVENARALLELQPSATLAIIPGAGHNVHQEKAEEVAERIENTQVGEQ